PPSQPPARRTNANDGGTPCPSPNDEAHSSFTARTGFAWADALDREPGGAPPAERSLQYPTARDCTDQPSHPCPKSLQQTPFRRGTRWCPERPLRLRQTNCFETFS